jgi:hypothetical protein
MKKKIVKNPTGKRLPADTAEAGGGAYAPHDHEAERLAENTRRPIP